MYQRINRSAGFLVWVICAVSNAADRPQAVDRSDIKAAVKTLQNQRDLGAMILAARTLRDLGSDASEQSEVLLPLLGHDSLSLRAMVLQALARTGVPSDKMLQVHAVAINKDEDLFARKLAIFAIGARANRTEQGISCLVKLLGNRNHDIAYYSAIALSDAKQMDAIPQYAAGRRNRPKHG